MMAIFDERCQARKLLRAKATFIKSLENHELLTPITEILHKITYGFKNKTSDFPVGSTQAGSQKGLGFCHALMACEEREGI